MKVPAPFLTAQWRWLVMLNYPVEPALLAPFVPRGTELDAWNGTSFVSMVGFLFLDTRVLGLPVPFHRDFEEVNLRFYVRRRGEDGEWRRGVVFVREIVPRRAIAWVANAVYNERYAALPMRHRVEPEQGAFAYGWRHRGRWNTLSARTGGAPSLSVPGSEEEFITEHYWGYTGQRDGGTLEYRVEHPTWRLWWAREATLECDVAALYGERFVEALGGEPSSAFVAEGSGIVVRRGVRVG